MWPLSRFRAGWQYTEWQMPLASTLPPEEGKRSKRERDLQIEYQNSFTNNTNKTNNINNQRNKAKYPKLVLSFPALGAWWWCPSSSCRQHQAVPDWTRLQTGTGLRDAWIGIWIRIAGRTMSRVLFRSRPWMKTARPSWCPSFKLSMTCMAWNTALVNIGSPVLSAPPHKNDPLRLLTCGV